VISLAESHNMHDMKLQSEAYHCRGGELPLAKNGFDEKWASPARTCRKTEKSPPDRLSIISFLASILAISISADVPGGLLNIYRET